MSTPPWVPPPPPTRRTADLALLLGLLSLPFSLLAGIPAVVVGIKALRVADRVGGRGRARVAVVLGSLTTLAALVGLGLLGLRAVEGLRDAAAPAGSARAQERDAARAAVDDAALVSAVGVPLEQLRSTPGVTLTHDPGATVDCVDSCSVAELAVTGAAAQTGPLARDGLVARLRAQGYAETVRDGIGCRPLDAARPCRLRSPDGASLALVSGTGPEYVLRVDGG